MIKFVSDLRQVGDFHPGTPFSSTNKTDCHDITEILLKVALNTINQPTKFLWALNIYVMFASGVINFSSDIYYKVFYVKLCTAVSCKCFLVLYIFGEF